MAIVIKMKTEEQRATKTVLDTILLDHGIARSWQLPHFQRPLRQNERVRALAETLKINGGVLPGIITLGKVGAITYLIDGQHRVEAFYLSGIGEAYVDVRVHFFRNESDMGKEFVELNSQLVRMNPDDILRGLEGSSPVLQLIRQKTSFVGYDSIRRSTETSPMVSMSVLLRAWQASKTSPPAKPSGGGIQKVLESQSMEDANELMGFAQMSEIAFGRDPEYRRLWGALNLTLTMWLYRKTVLDAPKSTDRSVRLTKEMFAKCMVRLSSQHDYLDFLHARVFSEEHRLPTYARIKKIFANEISFRLQNNKIKLPDMS